MEDKSLVERFSCRRECHGCVYCEGVRDSEEHRQPGGVGPEAVQVLRVHMRVLAMIVNTLIGRTALYGVEEFYESFDVLVLFGLDASASDFNDSTLARTLDKTFGAGAKRVFSVAAMQAVVHQDVKIDVAHSDTSSWLFIRWRDVREEI